MLDEVYKKASLTSVLTSDSSLIRMGNNAKEIVIPKMDMDGLKNYTRNSGYTAGDVKLEWQTRTFNYDRGIKFLVDKMDNEESIELAFGRLGAQFQRTKVAPEADAYTLSTLATKATANIIEYSLTSGENVLDALRAEQNKMDEDEVPSESRILFITPTLLRMAKSLDTYKNMGVLDEFAQVISVPQKRMYTSIELIDDAQNDADNNMKGGYKKGSSATELLFLIVEKSAVLKWDKHIASNIITPDDNQTSDDYLQKYRKYGIVDVFDNKLAGIRGAKAPLISADSARVGKAKVGKAKVGVE